MPKLLMFAPCERVIVSDDEFHASLIAIMQGFAVPPLPPEPPAQIVIPMTWFAYTLWETDESGSHYRQRIELESPPPLSEIIATLEVDLPRGAHPTRFHRVKSKFVGFPIRGIGDYTLRLLLQADAHPFEEVATFPIPVLLQEPAI